MIKYRINTSSPKRVTKVIVTGPPGSGRTTFALGLAKKYGLVYISTSELIKDMVKSKWKLSSSILELYSHGDLSKRFFDKNAQFFLIFKYIKEKNLLKNNKKKFNEENFKFFLSFF